MFDLNRKKNQIEQFYVDKLPIGIDKNLFTSKIEKMID
jgi:hypothetical protein